MPRPVDLYRIFVASPSDCRKERMLLRDLMADWNAVYGFPRGLHLEPVLWETHAYPEMSDRPQAVINRQLVDSCDALIGIFRGRLGSPSGVALSGTVEEIEIFRGAGKPVLLYFHSVKASSPAADSALAAYRQEVGTSGLVWTYGGYIDLVRNAAKHLAMTMTRLAGTPMAEATRTEETDLPASPPPAPPASARLAAALALREHTYFVWRELESLPGDRDSFECEVREATYQKIRGALDAMVADGLLTYRTELAYVTSFDEMPVLKIVVEQVSSGLRELVQRVVDDHGPRPSSGA